MNRMRGPRGFTLIELLVTVAVLAIVITLAVPSFQGVLTRAKLRSVANDLAAGAYLARSEAIKRNAVARLCAVTPDGDPDTDAEDTCGTDWNAGWIVRAGGEVIQRGSRLPTGYKILGGVGEIVFQPTGFGATAATLKVCRATPSVGPEEREVVIDLSGRAEVRRTQTASCS